MPEVVLPSVIDVLMENLRNGTAIQRQQWFNGDARHLFVAGFAGTLESCQSACPAPVLPSASVLLI